MSVDGSTIFREIELPTGLGGGLGPMVREDGIWQPLPQGDAIRRYTRDGVFIEDISVSESFPAASDGPGWDRILVCRNRSRGVLRHRFLRPEDR